MADTSFNVGDVEGQLESLNSKIGSVGSKSLQTQINELKPKAPSQLATMSTSTTTKDVIASSDGYVGVEIGNVGSTACTVKLYCFNATKGIGMTTMAYIASYTGNRIAFVPVNKGDTVRIEARGHSATLTINQF